MNADKQPVVLAAGGTGGHIFPAEALAEELIRRGERVVLVTDQRFAHVKTGALSQIEKQTLRLSQVVGGLHRKVIGMAGLGLGIMQARGILHKLKPKVVVGFGGYPSFPTGFAAARMGIPTVIHEQNSVLGRANRLLARRATRIATTFPLTQMLTERDQQKLCITGNPVRASVQALARVPYPTIAQDGKMHILVTGGSQGAGIFSQVVPAAITALPGALRARLRIDQQCRPADLEPTRAAYQQIGIDADLATFFSDIPARLASSHLVIARAGASTVCELAAAGRPAILVPLPTAMDNHQYFNANAFEDVGGGWVMTQDGFTAASLSARMEAFLTAPAALMKAAENARKLAIGDAAARLADLALNVSADSEGMLANGKNSPPRFESHSPASKREAAA